METAKLYYRNGDAKKAVAANQTLARVKPNSPLPYYNFGVYYMLAGDTAQAVANFEKSVERGSKDKMTYAFLYNYYRLHGNAPATQRIRELAARLKQQNNRSTELARMTAGVLAAKRFPIALATVYAVCFALEIYDGTTVNGYKSLGY